MKYFSRIKAHITQFSARGMSPAKIASGIALGNFIGFIPLIGVHTVMAIGLAYILRLNPLFVFLGTQISNPVSFPFLLFISAEIGNLLLKGGFLEIKFSKDINYLAHYILPLIVGSLVLGIIVSALSYFLIKNFLNRRHNRL